MNLESTPFTPFPTNVSDSGNASSPRDVEPFTGIELIVSGLRHENSNSANENLQQIIQNLKDDGHQIPPVNIISSPGSRSTDFVTVSLAGRLRETPRPDILERLRILLDGKDGIHAQWKVAASNTDKTRQVSFLADQHLPAAHLKLRLEAIFRSNGYDIQSCYIPSNSDRIVFNFLRREHVLRVFQQPPVVDGRAYNPTLPRYIQPLFGLEVAVNGVADIAGAKARLDRYIESRYGGSGDDPVVRHSRLELNSSVYCCILRTPAITSQLINEDPWTVFDDLSMGFSVPRPVYLYVLNTQGIPNISPFNRPSSTIASPNDPGVQRQLECVASQLETMKTAVDHLAQQLQGTVSAFNHTQDNMTQAFRSTELAFSLNNMLTATQSEVNGLRNSCTMYQLMLANATLQPDAQREIRDEISRCVHSIQANEAKRQTIVTSLLQARQSFASSPLLATTGVPGPPTIFHASPSSASRFADSVNTQNLAIPAPVERS